MLHHAGASLKRKRRRRWPLPRHPRRPRPLWHPCRHVRRPVHSRRRKCRRQQSRWRRGGRAVRQQGEQGGAAAGAAAGLHGVDTRTVCGGGGAADVCAPEATPCHLMSALMQWLVDGNHGLRVWCACALCIGVVPGVHSCCASVATNEIGARFASAHCIMLCGRQGTC